MEHKLMFTVCVKMRDFKPDSEEAREQSDLDVPVAKFYYWLEALDYTMKFNDKIAASIIDESHPEPKTWNYPVGTWRPSRQVVGA